MGLSDYEAHERGGGDITEMHKANSGWYMLEFIKATLVSDNGSTPTRQQAINWSIELKALFIEAYMNHLDPIS